MADLLVRRAARVFGYDQRGPMAVVILDGMVAGVLSEWDLPDEMPLDIAELDAHGGAVIPGFVDAHTHLVFASDRREEFEARLAGDSYAPGGIMRTVEATRAASQESLVAGVVKRADAALRTGTTTMEVKSGYGLTTSSERRLLEAVREARYRTAVELVPTFLGAHLDLGPGYLDLLIEEMIPTCAELAESCDVFCDLGAFSVPAARSILEAGRRHGLLPKMHAEQLAHTGAAELAADLECASADHLVHVTDRDAKLLAANEVVAVLLPASSFSGHYAYAPARTLIDAGVTVALATDCNPGTSYTTSMPFVIALACREYGLSVDEAVRAATSGGARALLRHDIGHLGTGARGDLVILEGDHWVDLAYHPGMELVAHVVKEGVVVR